MNIGVEFELPSNEYLNCNSIYKILSCIDIKRYLWLNIVDQCEIYDEIAHNNTNKNTLFSKQLYSGEEMDSMLSMNPYIGFLKIQAYERDLDIFEYHEYKDFISSDCRLIVLICDCFYVDIYAKDEINIENLYSSALEFGASNVKIKTDEIDSRTRLDVL